MCSAHCLTERNIRVKYHENQSKGSGDMEWTGKCYGRTDEGHSYSPPSASRRGDKTASGFPNFDAFNIFFPKSTGPWSQLQKGR